jgi:hypothetical protein
MSLAESPPYLRQYLGHCAFITKAWDIQALEVDRYIWDTGSATLQGGTKFAHKLSTVSFLVENKSKILYNICPQKLNSQHCTSPSNEVTKFFIYFSHGVRLSPLGTAATVWSIVPAPCDRWLWRNRWNANWEGKPKYSEKTCPSATLSITNPTWPDPGSNSGRRVGKPATNRLSYYTA